MTGPVSAGVQPPCGQFGWSCVAGRRCDVRRSGQPAAIRKEARCGGWVWRGSAFVTDYFIEAILTRPIPGPCVATCILPEYPCRMHSRRRAASPLLGRLLVASRWPEMPGADGFTPGTALARIDAPAVRLPGERTRPARGEVVAVGCRPTSRGRDVFSAAACTIPSQASWTVSSEESKVRSGSGQRRWESATFTKAAGVWHKPASQTRSSGGPRRRREVKHGCSTQRKWPA
jgi:hypothetical protein